MTNDPNEITTSFINRLRDSENGLAIIVKEDGEFSFDSQLDADTVFNIIFLLMQENDIPIEMLIAMYSKFKRENADAPFAKILETFTDEINADKDGLYNKIPATSAGFFQELSSEAKVAVFDIYPIVMKVLDALSAAKEFAITKEEAKTAHIVFSSFMTKEADQTVFINNVLDFLSMARTAKEKDDNLLDASELESGN